MLQGAQGANGAQFPLGDLNWFPTKKAAWLAQRDAEYAYIKSTLDNGDPLGIREAGGSVPSEFNLDQNYPNPFNPSTQIDFTLPKASVVDLKVFNALGQEVASLAHGVLAPGQHTVQFNASNLASGIYFYRLNAGEFSSVKKMMFVK